MVLLLYKISLQVSTNGYISFNGVPHFTSYSNFPVNDSSWIVAPFAADIDTTVVGKVEYTDAYFSQYQMQEVADFIIEQTGNKRFDPSAMTVAQWTYVALPGPSVSQTYWYCIIASELT